MPYSDSRNFAAPHKSLHRSLKIYRYVYLHVFNVSVVTVWLLAVKCHEELGMTNRDWRSVSHCRAAPSLGSQRHSGMAQARVAVDGYRLCGKGRMGR